MSTIGKATLDKINKLTSEMISEVDDSVFLLNMSKGEDGAELYAYVTLSKHSDKNDYYEIYSYAKTDNDEMFCEGDSVYTESRDYIEVNHILLDLYTDVFSKKNMKKMYKNWKTFSNFENEEGLEDNYDY